MALFDFWCKGCDQVREHLVKDPKEKVACEKCGGPTKRMIGLPGKPVFKGPGFYQNDYRSGTASTKESDEAKRAADRLAEADPNAPALDQD